MDERNFRRTARERLEGNWGLSIGTAFVASLFGGLLVGSSILNLNIDTDILSKLPSFLAAFLTAWTSVTGALGLAQFILGGTVQLGYARFLLNQHDGQPYEFRDLFSLFSRFSAGFLQQFLRTVYVCLWSLLLLIPGIIKSYSYAMTPFILVDHPELTASQAINASKEMMDGHKSELFVLDLSYIGWTLLGILTLNIGFLWINPYRNAAYAAFYRALAPRQDFA